MSLILTGNTSNITIDSNNGITFPSNTTQNTAYQTRFKNRFINGNMQIAQRANSATVTAGTSVPTASTGYPSVDRWFVYSTGANITAAQVAGSNNTQNVFQITGAASVTAIGVGQRIENNNSYDLAGQTVTLSVNMSNSLLSNVTWTASYANTSNTFGTIGTPTKTQIATGAFTVNSTLTNYSTQISIPSAATTGIEILFTVGAQTSGTWVIGNAQVELGATASAFEYVDYTTQFSQCQRYYLSMYNYGTAVGTAVGDIRAYPNYDGPASISGQAATLYVMLPTTMRTSPTVSYYDGAGTVSKVTGIASSTAQTNGVNLNDVQSNTKGIQFRAYDIAYYGFGLVFTASAEL